MAGRQGRFALSPRQKRGNENARFPEYREAIHKAVCDGGDRDAYTGERLNWKLILTYNNDESKKGRRKYKKKFWYLPTVDHVGDGMGRPNFKICGWRTNDCKNDLTVGELKKFCEAFLAHPLKKG